MHSPKVLQLNYSQLIWSDDSQQQAIATHYIFSFLLDMAYCQAYVDKSGFEESSC